MTKKQNIFLIGPMAAGKTSIGRAIARLLSMDFYDVDHEIEARTGANIPWIFDIEGEKGFRARETSVIDELVKMNGIVLATGGGAVVTPENRTALAEHGVVVYLQASLNQQLERTERGRNRPLLNSQDRQAVLTKLKTEREPLYEELADVVYDTNRRSVKKVAEDIVKTLRKEGYCS